MLYAWTISGNSMTLNDIANRQMGRQTNRHTDLLIAILHDPTGDDLMSKIQREQI